MTCGGHRGAHEGLRPREQAGDRHQRHRARRARAVLPDRHPAPGDPLHRGPPEEQAQGGAIALGAPERLGAVAAHGALAGLRDEPNGLEPGGTGAACADEVMNSRVNRGDHGPRMV